MQYISNINESIIGIKIQGGDHDESIYIIRFYR